MSARNLVYCGVCGVEYDAAKMAHTCEPESLEIIFMQEQEQPEACNLNGDDLARIKREIEDNGNPAYLVSLWEKSAGRPYGS